MDLSAVTMLELHDSATLPAGVDLRSLCKNIPQIKNIDRAILDAIQAGGTLDMRCWHQCETTHCRAGWAIHLAGKRGYELEKKVGPRVAGALIYAASRPDKATPNFMATREETLADLKECAKE